MMKTLLLASLTLLPALAAAQPTPPTPPGPPPTTQIRQACSAAGDVLFEIDHGARADAVNRLTTSELVLREGGMWTITVHAPDGKLERTASGCLSSSQMKTIRDDLKRATWTVKHAEATCAAISDGFTRYSSHGSVVWTAKMCQIEYLDEVSERSLEEIENILVTASTPVTPPCCKH